MGDSTKSSWPTSRYYQKICIIKGTKMTNDETKHAVNLKKSVSPGLEIITLNRKTYQEYFITAVPEGNECVESLFQRVAEAVQENNAQIVSQEVFGILDKNGRSMQALRHALGRFEGPVTWLEDGHTKNLCGTQIWAVSGKPVKQLELDGRIVGSLFEDEYAQYCHLDGLLPRNLSQSRSEQAAEIFEQMDRLLLANGMDFTHVLRTWFYNDDILDWYGDFNKVRDSFFQKKQVYERLIPASTGVGGRNAAGTAIVSGMLAVKAKSEGVRASVVHSPLQFPAIAYGSSFSRAVELDLPDHQRLYISGTASIDPDGTTAHIGDPEGQVTLTMKVVHAILKSRSMSWTDVTRALAYFKHAEDTLVFEKYCTLIPPLPLVIVENDICRDDLLFEIEMDAIKTQ
jgi:enamine deaminase RidA (YjgF/YER057c/UK114 family)